MKTLQVNNLRTLETKRLPTLGQRANLARRLKTSQRDAQRLRVWRRDPRCAACGAILAYTDFELDHIVPLSDGGRTEDSNCQVLHPACHRDKTNAEVTERAKRRAGVWIYGECD